MTMCTYDHKKNIQNPEPQRITFHLNIQRLSPENGRRNVTKGLRIYLKFNYNAAAFVVYKRYNTIRCCMIVIYFARI